MPAPEATLLDLLNRLQIVLDYRSVYGQPFAATFSAQAALASEPTDDPAKGANDGSADH